MNGYQEHFEKMKKKKSASQKIRMNYHSNRVETKKSHQVLAVLCLSVLSIFAFYGIIYPEDIQALAKESPISFFPKSLASSQATPSTPAVEKQEKKSSDPSTEKAADAVKSVAVNAENPSYLMSLVEKEKNLKEKESRLQELEEKLQQQKEGLQKQLDSLEGARREIASKLESRVNEDQTNVDKLVGVYSNMKPQNAAIVISKLQEDLAVSILRKMKKQDAGSILNYIEPQKAKVLSEKYSGY